uniref:RNA-directed DNA polymerase n=1 Tax=Strongyloides stercoralis TaxID=6248 RepID=A0A0K0EP92_STRER
MIYMPNCSKDSVESNSIPNKSRNTVYVFNRLVMGATNSPMLFQRAIEILLHDIMQSNNGNILIYQDDLLITTIGTPQQHFDFLRQIFKVLNNAGTKLNIRKCEFLRTKLDFLSWTFEQNKYYPSQKSVTYLLKQKRPVTKANLYKRLQAFNYFRSAIPRYDKITKNLYKLTHGNKRDVITWTSEDINSYNLLVTTVTASPPLQLLDNTGTLSLHIDACQSGLGGFLSKTINNTPYPVFYFSYPIKESKRYRSATYLELLAIKKGLQACQPLISNVSQLQVFSDHRPLEALIRTSTSHRYMDLIESIAAYGIKLTYVNGSSNKLADELSRVFQTNAVQRRSYKQSQKLQDENIIIQPFNIKELQKDVKIIEALNNNQLYYGKEIILKDDGIVVTKNDNKIVFPDLQHIDQQIFMEAHDRSGHFGQLITKNAISNLIFLPRLDMKLKEYITNCEICQKVNAAPQPVIQEDLLDLDKLNNIVKNTNWIYLAADCCGPLPQTCHGNRHYLLIVDISTKYVVTKALMDTKSESIITAFKEIFSIHGKGTTLKTDNAKYFTATQFVNYMKEEHITHLTNTPKNSKGNCYAERYIRTISEIVTKLQLIQEIDWDLALPQATYLLNTIYRKNKLNNPFEEHFGRKPKSNLALLLQTPDEYSEYVESHRTFQPVEPSNVYVKLKNTQKLKPRYDKYELIGTGHKNVKLKSSSNRTTTRPRDLLKGWKS